jgi:hypothetical protein
MDDKIHTSGYISEVGPRRRWQWEDLWPKWRERNIVEARRKVAESSRSFSDPTQPYARSVMLLNDTHRRVLAVWENTPESLPGPGSYTDEEVAELNANPTLTEAREIASHCEADGARDAVSRACVVLAAEIARWEQSYAEWLTQQGIAGLPSAAKTSDEETEGRWFDKIEREGKAAGVKKQRNFAEWINLTEREPEPRQAVLVESEGWRLPKVLEFEPFPHPRLIDRESGRFYWYPERMRWMPLIAAPSLPAQTPHTR